MTTPHVPDSGTVDLLERVAAFAQASGLDEEAAALRAEIARASDPGAAVVLVVGETQRGKSSLVNALAGRPGLLPVGSDEVTNAYIAVGYAETERARIFLHPGKDSGQGPDPVDIAVDEIADYATENGNPGNAKGVRTVEVGLPARILQQGLTLVDTPGVGGLDTGHADLTLACLGGADALLFVVDAGAPLTSTEIEFLNEAGKRIATVVFALTKIDAYPAWREILAANREILASQAPRFEGSTFVPVSAALYDNGQHDAADADLRAQLTQESGLPRLVGAVQTEILDRAGELRATAQARVLSDALDRIESVENFRARSATADPSLERELIGRQDKVAAFGAATAHWRSVLDDEFRVLGIDAGLEIHRRLDDLARRTHRRITAGSQSRPQQLPRELNDALEARWIEVATWVRGASVAVARRMSDRFLLDGIDLRIGDLALPEGARPNDTVPTSAPESEPEWSSAALRYGPGVAAGLSAPVLVPALLFSLPFVPFLVIPAGLGLIGAGLVTGRWLDDTRREEVGRARSVEDTKRFVDQAVASARAEMTAELEKSLIAARGAFVVGLERRISDRNRDLGEALGEHRARMAAGEAEQAADLRAAQDRLAEVATLRAAAKGAGPVATPVSATAPTSADPPAPAPGREPASFQFDQS